MKYSIYAEDIDGQYKRHGQSATLKDARAYKKQLKQRGLNRVHIYRLSDGVCIY